MSEGCTAVDSQSSLLSLMLLAHHWTRNHGLLNCPSSLAGVDDCDSRTEGAESPFVASLLPVEEVSLSRLSNSEGSRMGIGAPALRHRKRWNITANSLK